MFVNFADISQGCAKTLLLILNGCCILIALCTFIFAVVDTKILKQYGEERASGTFTGDVIIIVTCLLLISVAAFGSVGAVKGDVKILYLYIGFLMMLVILELLIAIYVSLQRYGLEFKVSEWLREDFFKNTTEDIMHNDLWDNLQISLIALCTFIFAVVDTKILKQYGEERASGTFTGDVIIIVTCLLLISVAAFGSVGAVKGDVKILYLYIGFLMMLVILELLIAIYVSLQRYGLEFKVSEWLREDFFKNTTEDIMHNDLWDNLQISYECCGLNGPDDYLAVRKQISLSCCPRAFRARTTYARQQLYRVCIESSTYYNDGCEDEILYALRADANWLVGVAITCFWFEAAGMLLAMWVGNNSRNEVSAYKQSIRY